MIKQIIIRNDSSSGYKVVNDNLEESIDNLSDDLMIDLIPRCANKNKINYFFKETLDSEVLVKLVSDNNYDDYNRPIAKSHCLIIPEERYIEKRLRYFISPLTRENELLNLDQFLNFQKDFSRKSLRITLALKKLLQAVLLYRQVIILTPTTDQDIFNQLIELIASIEEFIPYELSKTLRIKSYINNEQFSDINIGITNDEQILNYSLDPNNDLIVFRTEYSPYNLETDRNFNVSPIIDDIVNVVINPVDKHEETLQSLFDTIFSINKALDHRIDYNFKEKFIERWNVKKNKTFKLRKYLKNSFSRSSPKSLS